MHTEGPEPQMGGNANVVIEFRAGEMAQERVQLGSRGHTLVLGGVGVRTGEVAGPRSPILGYSPAGAEGQVLLSCGRLRQSPRHSCPRSQQLGSLDGAV